MAFRAVNKSAEEAGISNGSLGARLSQFREFRNLSQKELGELCGFNASNPDARVAQYEKMRRTPNPEVIDSIAKALGISKYALFETDFVNVEQMYQALFEFEKLHGLHPEIIDGRYCLCFEEDGEEYKEKILPFLMSWYETRKEFYEESANVSDEERKDFYKEYVLWCAAYPMESKKRFVDYRNAKKMEELQKQMDLLNTEMHSSEEKEKIEQLKAEMMPQVALEFKSVKKASEFCKQLLKSMKAGLIIEWHITDEYELYSNRRDPMTTVFSFNSRNIFASEENKLAYCEIASMLDAMREYDTEADYKVSSKKNEFWLDYYCPGVSNSVFEFVTEHWEEMSEIVEMKKSGLCTEEEIAKKEKKFINGITGKNDRILCKPLSF